MEETLSKPRKVIVIHSPHYGRSTQLSQALTYLHHTNIEIADVLSIADLDSLPAQGTYWQENGIDIAVAAGGDGLVGGVITHIAECSLPLGILPLGTANDIARSLDIPQDLQWAGEVIAHGRKREIDIGIACPAEQTPHLASPEQDKPVLACVLPRKHGFFAHALTIGLNVQFARLATNLATRQRYGRMTYPFVALEVLRNRAALEIELRFEGLALQQAIPTAQQSVPIPLLTNEDLTLCCRALQVAVINAPIFGGSWQLSIPGASLNDRLLDIVVVEDIDPGNLNVAIARLVNRQEQQPTVTLDGHTKSPMLRAAELTDIPGIHHVRARGVIIATNIDPQDVTLDGEVRGQTPTYVSIANERLSVIIP